MKREAANRILIQLEKRRSHAEKVFVENDKRSKLALEKLRQEAKQEDKQEQVLQCVELCCRVLQCVAVCCSVLQCVAVCCSVLPCEKLQQEAK